MSFASLALGFGLGVLSASVVAAAVAGGAFVVAWRWARALDRHGIDVTIRQDAPGG